MWQASIHHLPSPGHAVDARASRRHAGHSNGTVTRGSHYNPRHLSDCGATRPTLRGRTRALTDWLTDGRWGFSHADIICPPSPPLQIHSKILPRINLNPLKQVESVLFREQTEKHFGGARLLPFSRYAGLVHTESMKGGTTSTSRRKGGTKGKKNTHSPNPPRRVLKAAHTKGRAARRRHGGRLSACAWERPDYTEQSGGSSPGAFTQTMKEVQHLHLPGSKGRRKSNSDT